MLENLSTDEEKTGCNRNAVLQKDTETSVVGAISKEDVCKKMVTKTTLKSEKKLPEISRADNEQEAVGKLNPHRAF